MPANIAKDKFGYLSVYGNGEKPWHPEVGTIVLGTMTAEGVIRESRRNGGKGLGFIVDTAPAYAPAPSPARKATTMTKLQEARARVREAEEARIALAAKHAAQDASVAPAKARLKPAKKPEAVAA